jgi:hypothetical protein
MYIRHPEMRNDKFQEKAARLGEVTLESIKTQDSSGFQMLFKEICSETKLVPEQLAIFFTEKKLAVIKPPLPRFFSLTSQELFDCLRDGLPDDVDANSSTEKKQELVNELKDIIKDRNHQFREKMMEMLEVFSNSIQYQGIKYEKEQITVTYVNEKKADKNVIGRDSATIRNPSAKIVGKGNIIDNIMAIVEDWETQR